MKQSCLKHGTNVTRMLSPSLCRGLWISTYFLVQSKPQELKVSDVTGTSQDLLMACFYSDVKKRNVFIMRLCDQEYLL